MSAIFGETLIFQPENGSEVELVVFGDEFYARYETKDGYTVVYDPDRELYCYALLLNGQFASSGIPLSKRPPPDIRRGLRESETVRNEKFAQRYADLRPPETDAASNIARTLGPNNGLLRGRRVSAGHIRGLTVLVEFADLSSAVTTADVEEMLNAPNYQENGNFKGTTSRTGFAGKPSTRLSMNWGSIYPNLTRAVKALSMRLASCMPDGLFMKANSGPITST
jgi:hypothetical protein